MMKDIEASTGDDHVLRPDRPNEIRMARCAAAMIRDFQNCRLQEDWMSCRRRGFLTLEKVALNKTVFLSQEIVIVLLMGGLCWLS